MYISKLHLHGFKSFLNKTDLHFGKGLTVVVGPNGCGKSNIVDAIRWILGEQKTSVLRSMKMEDVIFNGSKFHKPIGFCEVKLAIHNDNGRLPVEYSDVEITRRLYRSGESEYLMNKIPCRLKDITELFIDSGMGAHAYSVIELKMIDQILSHNPSERKKLFEEAAGINQYKAQRQATFRKLEVTEIDLDRVRDIISEVDKNVKNLRLQLKRFKRHEKLTEKLYESEIILAQAKIQILNINAVPLRKKFSEKKSQHSSLSGQMSLDEDLMVNIQKKYDTAKFELNTSNNELRGIETQLREVNNNLLVWTEQKKSVEHSIKQYADDQVQNNNRIDTIATQIEDLMQNITKYSPQIESLKNDYETKKAEFEKINVKYDRVQSEYNVLQKKYESNTKSLHKHESKFQHEKAKIEEKQANINNLHQRQELQLNKIGQYQFDLQEFQNHLKKQEKLNSDISIELDKLQNEQAEVEDAIIHTNENRIKKESELTSLNSKLKFYRDILENREGQSSGVKYVLDNQNRFLGVIGVVADLIEVEHNHSLAVEFGLGEIIDYLIVDNQKNAFEIINTLLKEKHGLINIIQLDLVPDVVNTEIELPEGTTSALKYVNFDKQYAKLFNFLLSDLLIIETPEIIQKMEVDFRNNFNIVTANGEIFFKRYLLKSGQKSKESVLGRQKQIEQLENEQNKLNLELIKIKEQIKTHQKTADTMRFKVREKTKELEKSIKKLNNLEKSNSQTQFALKHTNENITDIEQQIYKNKNEIDNLVDIQQNLKTTMEEQKLNVRTIQSSIEDLNKEVLDLRSQRNRQQQNVHDARVKLIEIQKEIEGYEFRLDSARDQARELQNRNNIIDIETGKLRQQIQKLIENITTGESQKIEVIESHNILINQKNEIEKKHNDLYEELQNLQQNVLDSQKFKESVIVQIQKLELQISEINKEKELIQSRIKEVYQTEVPTNILNLDELDINELKDSIESTARSIQRIGPVNLTVNDEYERENQRLEFLSDQLNDLVESENNLRSTINKIDDEARSKFKKTFAEISENFQKTYAMFFEGGEAHIRLIGDDDPLESEIEIIARPPGKKTQTIRMLSAGEKALTAISLLFAIYLVKPSPFCILDEVDAPLDDANIGKFTSVLQKFSDNTQFIVVTHNKLTMEKADYLYGVTQELDGISKVVSVKFRDNPEMNFAQA